MVKGGAEEQQMEEEFFFFSVLIGRNKYYGICRRRVTLLSVEHEEKET